MGTPEDVETEKYFTPPDRRTLTEMLNDNGDYYFRTCEIEAIKDIFKAWLREVGTGAETPETKIMRKTLIILVDEP